MLFFDEVSIRLTSLHPSTGMDNRMLHAAKKPLSYIGGKLHELIFYRRIYTGVAVHWIDLITGLDYGALIKNTF